MMTDQDSGLENTLPKEHEFTINDVRKIIPPKLFKRSYKKSFYWLSHDIILITIMYYVAISFVAHIPFVIIRVPLWIVWWYFQGLFFMGIWVLAHDCGHNAFTPNKVINNIVGFIVHTMLLTPYFSWQRTHSIHHSKINHGSYDTVHQTSWKHARSRMKHAQKPKVRGTLYRIKSILTLSLLGWPLYLFFNVSGSNAVAHEKWVNHFNPYCAYFRHQNGMFKKVIISDCGLIFWCYCLVKIYKLIGFYDITFYYFIPYLITNHWVVIITFLQHTNWDIPKFKGDEWEWLRGAFCTIDRDFGKIFNYATHNITTSHVVHHLFAAIPHYNAIKATKYLETNECFSKYYRKSNQTWYAALWDIIGTGRWTKVNENVLLLKRL